jgi:hypothetical protein
LKFALAAAALGMSIGVNPATTLAALAPDGGHAHDASVSPAGDLDQGSEVAMLERGLPQAVYFKYAPPPSTSMKW